MISLSKEQRNLLAKVVLQARELAEAGSRKALHTLGVDESDAPGHLTPAERTLRRALRAQARQLGDREDPAKKGQYLIRHLVEKIAYDQWHRLLFARFLAENDLLISPQHGVGVSLEDCGELAPELGLRDGWEVAARFAAQMLPQIFRADDPAGQIRFAPEDRTALQQLVTGLPRDTFLADDGLGWVYQFWQAQRKEEVNKSEVKIGADELSPVTQLFTEDYMVLFLLHNTLGAWWAGKRMEGITAATEEEARAAVALPGLNWEYLRFVRDEQTGVWYPAAGTFERWPKTAKALRLLDPCMGSGHFLVFAFFILVALRMAEEGLSQEEAGAAVLRDNLFGLELDPRCTQIAAFNLALAAWKLGGYGPLPPLHLACCGLSLDAKREDWLKLAEHAAQASSLAPEHDLLGSGDNLLTKQLRFAMGALYDLFQKAPVLGSLINPRRDKAVTYATAFHELQPLLEQALKSETTDETIHELAVTAQGMAKAAEILAGQFTLVATNVPYLGRGKQDEVLRDFCERYHADAKADLATCFVSRCLEFCAPGGTTALVTPQNWLFLGTFKNLRTRLLQEANWNIVVRLGPAAFQDMNWWAAKTALVTLTANQPTIDALVAGIDVSGPRDPAYKAKLLLNSSLSIVLQSEQLKNPDARLLLSELDSLPLLDNYATAFQGIATADYSRFGSCFWELPQIVCGWVFQQSTVLETKAYSGREHLLLWEDGKGGLAKSEQARIQGLDAVGKRGVAVSQMNQLPVTLFTGGFFDNNCSALVVHDVENWLAVWAFCSSTEFGEAVREIDQALKVTNASLTKVPFDLAHWQQVAAEKYPHGLPKPHSDDPTQWLFNGHPKGAEQPLQVAVARLLGYRWPRQTGSSFPDCPALEPDGLEPFADQDGIVCISAIKGEQPAAERLRALLAAAFGSEWSAPRQAELLAQVGAKTLEDWLRNGFFEQHCQLFHQRPFTWHIYDGRKDGFSALVNYHKLNRAALEKLIYTYLGDWLTRQRAAVEAGEEGSDAKLAAALELKANLEKILEGEAPYDIFVRWKPLEQQSIGWAPDLSDGVRLNIRPFMTAGVLRKNPKVHWNKDRGKDVPSAPWFKMFKGERINEHHLRLEEKRAARATKKK